MWHGSNTARCLCAVAFRSLPRPRAPWWHSSYCGRTMYPHHTFSCIYLFMYDHDINTSIMKWYEATIRIRKSGVRLPIIAMAAYTLKGDMDLRPEKGVDDYIVKPMKRWLLMKKLLKWLLNREIRLQPPGVPMRPLAGWTQFLCILSRRHVQGSWRSRLRRSLRLSLSLTCALWPAHSTRTVHMSRFLLDILFSSMTAQEDMYGVNDPEIAGQTEPRLHSPQAPGLACSL